MTTSERIQLITAKIEILKLQANGYDWQMIDQTTKNQLETTLLEIDKMLLDIK